MIESNPIRILKTLDSFLKDRIDLVVYGKAALHLLFQNDSSLRVTNDVDLIVPEEERYQILKPSRVLDETAS